MVAKPLSLIHPSKMLISSTIRQVFELVFVLCAMFHDLSEVDPVRNITLEDDITILNAHRWTLEKSALLDGKFVTTSLGVAYAWNEWQVGESAIRSPGGQEKILVDVDTLQAELDKQAALIRNLKEERGLGNKDPEVLEAVKRLVKLKEEIGAAAS